MVGSAARMRESSLTLPSSMGTLKSTRTKTRLPCGSMSLTVCFSKGGAPALFGGCERWCRLLRAAGRSLHLALSSATLAQLPGHERDEVRDAARVAPLVVVPGDDLDHVAEDDRVHGADDGRVLV